MPKDSMNFSKENDDFPEYESFKFAFEDSCENESDSFIPSYETILCDLNDIEENIKLMIEMESHTNTTLFEAIALDHLERGDGSNIPGVEYDTFMFNFSLGGVLDGENFFSKTLYGMKMMKMASS